MSRNDLLSMLLMRFCVVGIAQTLLRISQSLFRGSVKAIDSNGPLERGSCYIVLLPLRRQVPDEILRVGVVRVDCGDLIEIRNGVLRLPHRDFEQAQAEPGARIVRIALSRFCENAPSVFELAHVQKRDAHIQAARIGFRIHHARRLELSERLGELMALHKGYPQIVFADRVDVLVTFWRNNWRGSKLSMRAGALGTLASCG